MGKVVDTPMVVVVFVVIVLGLLVLSYLLLTMLSYLVDLAMMGRIALDRHLVVSSLVHLLAYLVILELKEKISIK